MRRKTSIVAVAVLAVLAAWAAAPAAWTQTRHYAVTIQPLRPAKGFETVRLSKAALGEAPILLWENTAIDPDCKAHDPAPTLTLLQPPAHGTVRISDEPFYFAYPAGNPRSACNGQKIPGHQAFYTAAAGYRGRDKLVLQGASPEGRVREIHVEVEVR